MSNRPDFDAREIGSYAIELASTDWVDLTSADFTNSATGEALPEGRKLVQLIVRNDHSTDTLYLVLRNGMTDEDPTATPGAIPVPAGEALTLPLYGANISLLSICGDGITGSIVGLFYPY